MPSFLYYRQGDEWVRVEADDYSRATTPADPGQCPGESYILEWTVTYLITGGRFRDEVRTEDYLDFATGAVGGPMLRPGNETQQSGYTEGGRLGARWFRANRFVPYRILSISNIAVYPRFPDSYQSCAADSEDACQTVFTLNGNPVLTLDSCPEVLTRDDCADCCRQLLPIARTITV